METFEDKQDGDYDVIISGVEKGVKLSEKMKLVKSVCDVFMEKGNGMTGITNFVYSKRKVTVGVNEKAILFVSNDNGDQVKPIDRNQIIAESHKDKEIMSIAMSEISKILKMPNVPEPVKNNDIILPEGFDCYMKKFEDTFMKKIEAKIKTMVIGVVNETKGIEVDGAKNTNGFGSIQTPLKFYKPTSDMASVMYNNIKDGAVKVHKSNPEFDRSELSLITGGNQNNNSLLVNSRVPMKRKTDITVPGVALNCLSNMQKNWMTPQQRSELFDRIQQQEQRYRLNNGQQQRNKYGELYFQDEPMISREGLVKPAISADAAIYYEVEKRKLQYEKQQRLQKLYQTQPFGQIYPPQQQQQHQQQQQQQQQSFGQMYSQQQQMAQVFPQQQQPAQTYVQQQQQPTQTYVQQQQPAQTYLQQQQPAQTYLQQQQPAQTYLQQQQLAQTYLQQQPGEMYSQQQYAKTYPQSRMYVQYVPVQQPLQMRQPYEGINQGSQHSQGYQNNSFNHGGGTVNPTGRAPNSSGTFQMNPSTFWDNLIDPTYYNVNTATGNDLANDVGPDGYTDYYARK